MKQKFENLGLILSRDAQKNLIGGSMNESFGSEGGGYMCCWDSNPNNCSECVPAGQPVCVKGASAKQC